MSDFTRIDALAAELRSLRPLNDGELTRLRGDFIIENTYNSNAIEGNTLTLRETALILKEGVTIGEKPLREHFEAIGHRDAFEYVITLADTETPLTERVIKDIHSLVLMNDALNKGTYRTVPVYILGALHEPPPPYLVPAQMETLIADYDAIKSGRHIIDAVSAFHLRFEGIHPFIDGNGRTGRLVLNLELIKAGLLPVNIKFADRRRYYDCFDDHRGDAHTSDTLARLVAEYEIEELERYIAIVRGK
ncbi:MAG: Fic family protein [Oscillospiraceae bacterium]|jgi:Fic family protein|nr:Fic family protein [Oscillospiraceae bacterium]